MGGRFGLGVCEGEDECGSWKGIFVEAVWIHPVK